MKDWKGCFIPPTHSSRLRNCRMFMYCSDLNFEKWSTFPQVDVHFFTLL
jgi:hypothetical protein